MSEKNLFNNDPFFSEFGDFLAECYDDNYLLDEHPEEAGLIEKSAQDFAQCLRIARTKAGLSRLELAEKTNLSEAKIVALEHGLILPNKIDAESLYALAKVLGVDIQEFALILGRNIPKLVQNGNSNPTPSLAPIPVTDTDFSSEDAQIEDGLDLEEDLAKELEEVHLLLQGAAEDGLLQTIIPTHEEAQETEKQLPPCNPYRTLYPYNEFSNNRANLCQTLSDSLLNPFVDKLVASLIGMGGMGKTNLAIELAAYHYKLKQEYNKFLEYAFRDFRLLSEIECSLVSQPRIAETEIIELIGKRISELVGCANIYTALYDEATKSIHFPWYLEHGNQQYPPPCQLREDYRDKTEEVILTRQSLLLQTKQQLEEWHKQPGRRELSGESPASWLGVPIVVDNKAIGVISIYDYDHEYAFDKGNLSLLSAIADRAATGIRNANLYKQVKRQASCIETLHQATKILAGVSGTAEDILQVIVEQARKVLRSDSAILVLYDSDNDTFTRDVVASGIPDHLYRQLYNRWQHRSNQDTQLFLQVMRIQNFQEAALAIGEEKVGVMFVNYKPPYSFDEEERKIAQIFANYAAVSLKNARLQNQLRKTAHIKDENQVTKKSTNIPDSITKKVSTLLGHDDNIPEASQRRAMEIAVVDDVAQTLSSTLELEEVLRRIMAQVAGMLNVGAGFLLLKDPVTGDLVFQFALGKQTKQVKPFRIPRGQGIAGQVAESGKAIFVNKQANSPSHIDFRAYNALCVPLILHEQVIGVLEVLNKQNGNFTQHDLELLSAVATFAAIAIENARLHESVLAERGRVIEAEEEARKALAQDFHDGPIQLIAGAIMRLTFCQRILDKEPGLLAKELGQTLTMTEQAMQQMRTTLFELRPLVLETEGLQAALEIFIERQRQDIAPDQSTKLILKIETTNPYGQISRLDKKIETAIFAIVQEAVSNAIKHACAGIIKVHLNEMPAGLYVLISDDGIGFDVEQVLNEYGQRASLGMINIKERVELIGGDLAIRSAPKQGTRIRVYIPKAQGERLKKRGKTGKLSNSRRIQTGTLARLADT
jgi:signal transduction histidine kinase/transcriptional regulator with XRE-family HTH domain